MTRLHAWLAAGSMVMMLAGCGSSRRVDGAYSAISESARSPLEAQRLTLRAGALIGEDPLEAERLLREALSHDLYHGPAHNNLGAIHLARGELYDAASEFEWARKLMPGHPDPRLNLGLALEKAGRASEAIEAYRTALDVYPGHLPTFQALSRCQLRHGLADDQTRDRLQEIALRGDVEWRAWAMDWLLRLGNL